MTGNHFRLAAKTIIKIIPSQKEGIAVPSCMIDREKTSMGLSLNRADKMPIRAATGTAINMEKIVTEKVTGRRCRIKVRTLSP